MIKVLALGFMCLAAVACAASAKENDHDGDDAGGGAPGIVISSSSGGDGGASAAPGGLTVTIRDFKFYKSSDPTTNPDFENLIQDDPGIVAQVLGQDQKPVYESVTPMTKTTHGKMYFDQWYNDVPGTNIKVTHPLMLTQNSDGTFGYNSATSGVPLSASDPRRMWFPIDDGTPYQTAFGNQGLAHNYSFTTELHTVFMYGGGESFTFSGDDDVFVFINGKLVIDRGGVHSTETATVALDMLGLTKGQIYHLDLFNAERHTAESNLSFTTSLNLQNPPQ